MTLTLIAIGIAIACVMVLLSVIFVPDSKTAEGRRLVPMSGRVFEILGNRCDARRAGCFHPNAPHQDTSRQFAISSERLATKRACRKNWFSTVRDTTMAREL